MTAEQISPTDASRLPAGAGQCEDEAPPDFSRIEAMRALADQFTHYRFEQSDALFAELQPVFMAEAAELCAWPLVLGMHKRMKYRNQSKTHERAQRECLLLAGNAALQMGYLDEAEALLRELLLWDPHWERALELHHFLCDWKTFCACRGTGPHLPWNGEQLHLQLLGHQHLQSFAQIYSDETAYLCRLPSYASDQDWHQWLDAQHADAAERLFAVMHGHWGMIGVVSLVMHQRRGFFYYWVGEEFRGQGFGPQAVAVLLDTAREHWGIHTCFAKAYEFNQPSRTGLKKLGFEELRVRAAPPSENEVFFRWGPELGEQPLVEEMRWFYERIDCERRFLRLVEPRQRSSKAGQAAQAGNQLSIEP